MADDLYIQVRVQRSVADRLREIGRTMRRRMRQARGGREMLATGLSLNAIIEELLERAEKHHARGNAWNDAQRLKGQPAGQTPQAAVHSSVELSRWEEDGGRVAD